MKRPTLLLLLVATLISVAAPARGAVNVERRGDENPMAVIAKSTAWGMVTGVLVGAAIDLAANTDSDAPIRWGVAVGTFGGLGVGIWHVSHRVEPQALLEPGPGGLATGGLAAFELEPGAARVRVVAVRF